MPPNFGLGMVLQGQDARHLGLRQDRPARRRLRQGLRHARAGLGQRGVARRAPSPTASARADSCEELLRGLRRAVAAPAAERRDARHRQARSARAHEADRAARQHLARRADRGRRAGRRRSTAAGPAWPRSTCSRASRSCRAIRCCASRTRSARRTSATSSRTATSCTSAPPSRTSSTSSTAPDQHRQSRRAARPPMKRRCRDGRDAPIALARRSRWALLFGNFVIGCGVMVVVGMLNDMTRVAARVGRARRPADRDRGGGDVLRRAAARRLGRRLRPAPPARRARCSGTRPATRCAR